MYYKKLYNKASEAGVDTAYWSGTGLEQDWKGSGAGLVNLV